MSIVVKEWNIALDTVLRCYNVTHFQSQWNGLKPNVLNNFFNLLQKFFMISLMFFFPILNTVYGIKDCPAAVFLTIIYIFINFD